MHRYAIGTLTQMRRVTNWNLFFWLNLPKSYQSTSFNEMFLIHYLFLSWRISNLIFNLNSRIDDLAFLPIPIEFRFWIVEKEIANKISMVQHCKPIKHWFHCGCHGITRRKGSKSGIICTTNHHGLTNSFLGFRFIMSYSQTFSSCCS